MPVYNAERFLAQSVESILGQTFGDFEFVIVDDGSADGSLEILRGYEAKDSRIRLISRGNTGMVGALNDGLGVASGPLVARMDADDIAERDRFAEQVQFMEEHPECVAVGSRVLLIDPEGMPIREMFGSPRHEDIDGALMAGRGGEIPHPSVIMRRAALDSIGGYRAEYWPAEDRDLFLRLAEVGRLANIPRVLLKYRQHAKSTGNTQQKKQRRAGERAVAEACQRRGISPRPPRPEVDPEHGGLTVADLHRRWAWWALRGRNKATARKHATRSLLHRPLSRESWRAFCCSLRGH